MHLLCLFLSEQKNVRKISCLTLRLCDYLLEQRLICLLPEIGHRVNWINIIDLKMGANLIL